MKWKPASKSNGGGGGIGGLARISIETYRWRIEALGLSAAAALVAAEKASETKLCGIRRRN